MGLLRRRRRLPGDYDTNELRSIARRLTGWTVTGTSSVDLERVLYRAADEIESLQEALRDREEVAA